MSPTDADLAPVGQSRLGRVRGVLDQPQPVLPADALERGEVGRVARVVHGHDGPRARRDGGRDRIGIEAQRGRVDVDEHGARACAHDHVRGGRPRQRRRDDLVALPVAHPERAQREVHRGGARRDRERERGLGVGRELGLQLTRERPRGQPAGLERAQHVGALLVAEGGRREVEPAVAAHGHAAGDGGKVDRNGHAAQDRASTRLGYARGRRKTSSLRLQVTTATSRPIAMGAAKAAPRNSRRAISLPVRVE